MKCKDFYPGMLRVGVIVEQKQRVPDGAGGSTDQWGTIASMKTAWKAGSATERLKAMAVDSRVMHTVYARYNPAIRPDMRLKDEFGEVYNIRGVVDIEKRRRWMELTIEEGAAS